MSNKWINRLTSWLGIGVMGFAWYQVSTNPEIKPVVGLFATIAGFALIYIKNRRAVELTTKIINKLNINSNA